MRRQGSWERRIWEDLEGVLEDGGIKVIPVSPVESTGEDEANLPASREQVTLSDISSSLDSVLDELKLTNTLLKGILQ